MAREWAKNPTVQMYCILARRGVAGDDVKKFLAESFETSGLSKIERSRWSKTKGIGVVDHGDVVDLEMVLKDKNTGLSPEEKKKKGVDEGIDFGQVMAGDVSGYISALKAQPRPQPQGRLSAPWQQGSMIQTPLQSP